MSAVHFIMQGKGGVGKTFTASLLAQYLIDNRSDDALPLRFIDTDLVNATFSHSAPGRSNGYRFRMRDRRGSTSVDSTA